ncbi:Inner membrane protein yrbG [Ewingella americana]|uniref:Inner membrane protein yrbG n=1 Tax=Ewingella americana TaxID=41202 RepID=A0A377NIF4_9GAMM|nr:Inner membrane protein yrbG [Ewingella americana]
MPLASSMIVDNSTVIARYFGVSELIIGLTVVAIGTSLPELATFIAGAVKGEDDIALGNIIGANIFNTCLVLGLPALVAPGSFSPEAFHRDYWVMLAVSGGANRPVPDAQTSHRSSGGNLVIMWLCRLPRVALLCAGQR